MHKLILAYLETTFTFPISPTNKQTLPITHSRITTHELPKEANVSGQRNTQFITDSNNTILQGNAVNDIVRKIFGVLQRQRFVAHDQLPNLLPSGVENGPGAEVKFPVCYGGRVGFWVEVSEFRSWVIFFLESCLGCFFLGALRHRMGSKVDQFGVAFEVKSGAWDCDGFGWRSEFGGFESWGFYSGGIEAQSSHGCDVCLRQRFMCGC